jgi:hypothetical protein
MKKIIYLIFLIFCSQALANGTSDCIKISDGKMITHDLNTPYLDNCYVIDNNQKSGLLVSVGFIDGLQGTVNVKRYSASTGDLVTLDNQYSSNGATTFHYNNNIGNDQYVIRLNNLTSPNQAKNLSISKVVVNNLIYVTIAVRNVALAETLPPPTGAGGYCDPQTGICYEPQSADNELLSFASMNSSEENECTGDLAPPPGFNENYDIELEAQNMRIFAQEIDSQALVPSSVKTMQKALYFSLVMAPRSFYDLKTNVNWLSTADAGNYNYGFLGSAIGFEKETLIQMSGLIQLVSDEFGASNQDYPFLENMAQAIFDNDFSQFDNYPEDPREIVAGYDAEKSGCSPNTRSINNNRNGSGTGGYGNSGWSPFSRIFIGASGCIGNCSTPIGKVDVTDLAPE